MIWSYPNEENQVYLTFDDGPIPVVTPWVLDILAHYEMKATFFVVGDNVAKNPDLYHRILDEGHTVGNHTYNHLNGWKTDIDTYMNNIYEADKIIQTNLFRPPYGRLKPAQNKIIRDEKTIVMWDVLSGDFDQNISPQRCLDNVLENYNSGSIIVFHDSLKAEQNLRFALPKVLENIETRGFKAANLSCIAHSYAY